MATPIINSQMDAINESFSNISSDLTTIRPLLKNASIGAYPTDTASGSIASFTDGAEGIPVKSLSVDLEPVQDLNGYDNPWPAGGGKNKFDASLLSDVSATLQNITVTLKANTTYTMSSTIPIQDGSTANLFFMLPSGGASSTRNGVYNGHPQTVTTGSDGAVKIGYRLGDNTASQYASYQYQIEEGSTATAYAPYSNICPISGHTEANVTRTGKNLCSISGGVNNTVLCAVKSGRTYTFSLNAINQCGFNLKKNSNSGARINGLDGITGRNSLTFTADEDFNLFINGYSQTTGVTFANSVTDFQLELGSTATAYEPYAGQTYNVPLGQTVYGGTLDVVSGVLTADRAMVDLGTLDWTLRSGSKFSATLSQAANVAINVEGHLCSCMPIMYVAGVNGTNDGYFAFYKSSSTIASTTIYVNLEIEGITSVDALNEWFASYNAQLVYELATPQTYQLTATQVSTLLGANNIFADAGTVSVVYRANTELYIDKKLAQALNA